MNAFLFAIATNRTLLWRYNANKVSEEYYATWHWQTNSFVLHRVFQLAHHCAGIRSQNATTRWSMFCNYHFHRLQIFFHGIAQILTAASFTPFFSSRRSIQRSLCFVPRKINTNGDYSGKGAHNECNLHNFPFGMYTKMASRACP